MRRQATVLASCLLVAALALQPSEASFERFLPRRQAETGTEQESTTTPKPAADQAASPASSSNSNNNHNNNNHNHANSPQPHNNGRLYPDLPHGHSGPNFIPPFNAPPHHAQPPFVPYGLQMPGGNGPPLRLNADQQPAPFGRMPANQPRPMSASERLQSQTFTDGLGKRLLSMIGIRDLGNQTAAAAASDAGAATAMPGQAPSSWQLNGQMMDAATMRALQNATVLDRLNQRVGALMGGLSRVYNSTVQEQLSLLNERFKKASENGTNPWQARMAEQVPQFFKQMAARVGQAQEQLNRMVHEVGQAAQGNASLLNSLGASRRSAMPAGAQPGQGGFFNSFNQFMGPDGLGLNFGALGGGQPHDQPLMTRSLGPDGGAGSEQPASPPQQQPDMAARLREFWHLQVAPQVGMLRNQMSRMWRDMTASGALAPENWMRARSMGASQGAPANRSAQASSDLVDNILKEVDNMTGASADTDAEFALVDSKGEPTSAAAPAESGDSPEAPNSSNNNKPEEAKPKQSSMMPKLSPQMQNRLMEMQRDLNQLWAGLSESIQNAMVYVRRSKAVMEERAGRGGAGGQLEPAAAAAATATDPNQNEIDDKISELTKLQRDADAVQQVVAQQQRETQQRQSMGDRFRGFINNMDMNGIGEQINRFGNAVGTFWNQIPDRWDNFMAGARQPNGGRDGNMMMA